MRKKLAAQGGILRPQRQTGARMAAKVTHVVNGGIAGPRMARIRLFELLLVLFRQYIGRAKLIHALHLFEILNPNNKAFSCHSRSEQQSADLGATLPHGGKSALHLLRNAIHYVQRDVNGNGLPRRLPDMIAGNSSSSALSHWFHLGLRYRFIVAAAAAARY